MGKSALTPSWSPLLCALLLAIAGCTIENSKTADLSGIEEPLQIVCTTGMIGDAMTRIAGDRAQVTSLMGPGVDPHLYKATQGDLRKLNRADVVFFNGLHLEGKMGEVLEKVGRLKPVIALGDSLPGQRLINSTNYASAYDPHIWFDVALWSEAVGRATQTLAKLDTTHRDHYLMRYSTFQKELKALDGEVYHRIHGIPEEQRILITAHDAFEYFGKAYDIEVRGLQGISTVSEFGLKDISDLVNLIVDRKIKAIFVESSVPPKITGSSGRRMRATRPHNRYRWYTVQRCDGCCRYAGRYLPRHGSRQCTHHCFGFKIGNHATNCP